MTDLKNIQNIYFIGIGGIGMSALARYFRFQGKSVSGYDKTETPLTKALMEEGIPVSYTDDPKVIPKDVQLDGLYTSNPERSSGTELLPGNMVMN